MANATKITGITDSYDERIAYIDADATPAFETIPSHWLITLDGESEPSVTVTLNVSRTADELNRMEVTVLSADIWCDGEVVATINAPGIDIDSSWGRVRRFVANAMGWGADEELDDMDLTDRELIDAGYQVIKWCDAICDAGRDY